MLVHDWTKRPDVKALVDPTIIDTLTDVSPPSPILALSAPILKAYPSFYQEKGQ